MKNPQLIKKKICLLGSFSVGKTSLVRRFVYDVFDDFYLSTLGAKVSQKIMPPVEKEDGSLHQFQLMLWDIEGQEKFSDYLQNYFQGSSGAVLVLDLTRKDSWQVLSDLKQQFLQLNPGAKFVLAANKVDLISDDHLHIREIGDFARDLQIDYFLTSAKDGRNVEALFRHLSMQLSE